MVDLDGLLGHPKPRRVRSAGPLAPEACRRLAGDGAVTRVLVSRHRTHPAPTPTPRNTRRPKTPTRPKGWWGGCGRRRCAPILGGAPTQPLEVGRTGRVVQAGQRAALAVRDGGGGFPGCARPLAWYEAHQRRHWLHGGPTDLANLALLCRAHHRAVHEGGWRLQRHPDGQLTATPPHRRPQRAPTAA